MSSALPSVLAEILDTTRERLATRRALVADEELEARLADSPRRGAGAFALALAAPGLSVIAEHKRRSPSVGELGGGSSVAEIAGAYERGGAAALSVLTEEQRFAGSLDDLRSARAATALPILRKDFIVDRYQLLEAAIDGADAVLLIVAALGDAELARLNREAAALALDVLVEVHDGEELRRAVAIGPRIVGINNRDLRDFSVDLDRALRLREALPGGVIAVAESGIDGRAAALRMERAEFDGVLVGERLMRAADPAAALRELRGL